MNIGIDFDGVIADTTELKVREAYQLFGVEVDPVRSKEYQVTEDGVLSKTQYRELMNHVCADPHIALSMTPCLNSIESVRELLSENYVLIITSRNQNETNIAKSWCKTKGLDIPFVSVGYGESKADAAKKNQLDVYIDDDFFKLTPLARVVPHLFLFSTPQNRNQPIDNGFIRVNNWPDLLKSINELGKRYHRQ